MPKEKIINSRYGANIEIFIVNIIPTPVAFLRHSITLFFSPFLENSFFADKKNSGLAARLEFENIISQ
ncbi:MAG TPA: hypothetical protein DCD97_02485 [Firmicutes bacterium]|jgi:hypothetical protein|nr:hypothetical protein [Bacillota bacterium]